MSRDKQIEEISKIAYDWSDWNFSVCKEVATRIYNTGYRKTENIARKIFAEIESKFHEDDVGDLTIDFMEFQELKKKYESEGEK